MRSELVSAFIGREKTLALYKEAVERRLMPVDMKESIAQAAKRLAAQKRAKKLTVLFGRQLDRFLGQSMFAKQQLNADDLCLDTDVDETVAKINFLKANGLGENTANEVAALLSAERLNKVRTREQQKKLNLALNGLLQVMSKKQEQAQVQPQPKEA